jgi:hypothetical protein
MPPSVDINVDVGSSSLPSGIGWAYCGCTGPQLRSDTGGVSYHRALMVTHQGCPQTPGRRIRALGFARMGARGRRRGPIPAMCQYQGSPVSLSRLDGIRCSGIRQRVSGSPVFAIALIFPGLISNCIRRNFSTLLPRIKISRNEPSNLFFL